MEEIFVSAHQQTTFCSYFVVIVSYEFKQAQAWFSDFMRLPRILAFSKTSLSHPGMATAAFSIMFSHNSISNRKEGRGLQMKPPLPMFIFIREKNLFQKPCYLRYPLLFHLPQLPHLLSPRQWLAKGKLYFHNWFVTVILIMICLLGLWAQLLSKQNIYSVKAEEESFLLDKLKADSVQWSKLRGDLTRRIQMCLLLQVTTKLVLFHCERMNQKMQFTEQYIHLV